jgi:hypothetical protein
MPVITTLPRGTTTEGVRGPRLGRRPIGSAEAWAIEHARRSYLAFGPREARWAQFAMPQEVRLWSRLIEIRLP